METELVVAAQGSGTGLVPCLVDRVEWTTQRRGAPGRLAFCTAADAPALTEGASVRFSVDGKAVFFGFLFTKKCTENGVCSVTAYDQIRYLRNRDTYVYENRTAAQLLRLLAADNRLAVGEVEDTGYTIASRVEDNTALLDMLENAIDITTQNTGETYVLYDDAGKLTLKNLRSMLVGGQNACLLLEAANVSGYEYASSIDDGSANRVKLVREDSATGRREVYVAQNSAHMNAWGVLQYYEKLSADENGQVKADTLLALYDRPVRSLRLKTVGDVRVRGGSLVAVSLTAGEKKLHSVMLVEKAAHTFRDGEHIMELTLRGAALEA